MRAAVCENDAERVETPVGAPCVLCEVALTSRDSGTLMAVRDESGRWHLGPVHRECNLRTVIGGAGHLAAPPHEPGECDPDGGLPRYRSALLVQSWVDRMDIENVLSARHSQRLREQLQREIEAALLEDLIADDGAPRGR